MKNIRVSHTPDMVHLSYTSPLQPPPGVYLSQALLLTASDARALAAELLAAAGEAEGAAKPPASGTGAENGAAGGVQEVSPDARETSTVTPRNAGAVGDVGGASELPENRATFGGDVKARHSLEEDPRHAPGCTCADCMAEGAGAPIFEGGTP